MTFWFNMMLFGSLFTSYLLLTDRSVAVKLLCDHATEFASKLVRKLLGVWTGQESAEKNGQSEFVTNFRNKVLSITKVKCREQRLSFTAQNFLVAKEKPILDLCYENSSYLIKKNKKTFFVNSKAIFCWFQSGNHFPWSC